MAVMEQIVEAHILELIYLCTLILGNGKAVRVLRHDRIIQLVEGVPKVIW